MLILECSIFLPTTILYIISTKILKNQRRSEGFWRPGAQTSVWRPLSGAPPPNCNSPKSAKSLNPQTPREGVGTTPLAFFPCNFFDDSNRKNRLSVSVTRDGRHILAYVTSSRRCHVTYVMTSYVHDGGQNTLFFTIVC